MAVRQVLTFPAPILKKRAAEIAQIRASGADSVFFFLPGGMGISFMKQYAGAGVEVPLIGPAFSFDQNILQAVGDAALGVKNTSTWSKDLDNEANKAFVAAYQAENAYAQCEVKRSGDELSRRTDFSFNF